MALPKSKSASKSPTTAKIDVAALEAKIAALESALAKQAQELVALKAQCAAKPVAPPSGSGLDEEVLTQLRLYFATASSQKVATIWPKL